MITLKDIAKEAGVSMVTVSNVINGKHKKVSSEKLALINSIIDKYNYTPNATARSLVKKESKIIGIVIPNVQCDDNFFKSPYNAEIIGVLERIVRMNDYYLMIRCVQDCKDSVPLIKTWNVDGVIFLGARKDDVLSIKKEIKLPMVFIDTYLESEGFVNVGADDYKGGYLATSYLISRGHEKILFASPHISYGGVIEERYLGYKDAMIENNLSDNVNNILAVFTSYDCGIEVGKTIAFMKEKYTAIVATADILALGIMEGLSLSGKRVPENISIIGFDNLPECKYSSPKLTTISQNISQKAEVAAEFLIKMIQGKELPIKNKKMDVELIERQSVKTLIK